MSWYDWLAVMLLVMSGGFLCIGGSATMWEDFKEPVRRGRCLSDLGIAMAGVMLVAVAVAAVLDAYLLL
jgi:hypothetical protein